MDINEYLSLTANFNGEIMPVGDVKVPALDRAFLFGDAVYEVIRVYDGHFLHLKDHLARLKTSLFSLKISGADINEIELQLNRTLDASRLKNALAYVQVTRGVAPRTHYYPLHYTPNCFMFFTPFDDPFAEQRKTGVKAVFHPDIRWGRNDIKATSLAANCIAASFAREQDCMEVVFYNNDNYISEGSHTSLFGIKDGKLLLTPASKHILPGITKKQIIELACIKNIPTAEARLTRDEVLELDEFFLSGTPEEIIGIVQVDETIIGKGRPGPITNCLHEAFREVIAQIKSG
ncbi:MAG: aminotransferase class IV [Candidatus Melainabacteria bacterium]|nr:aminotransferase class IV [Candidatus Melainabacteria bacterium]